MLLDSSTQFSNQKSRERHFRIESRTLRGAFCRVKCLTVSYLLNFIRNLRYITLVHLVYKVSILKNYKVLQHPGGFPSIRDKQKSLLRDRPSTQLRNHPSTQLRNHPSTPAQEPSFDPAQEPSFDSSSGTSPRPSGFLFFFWNLFFFSFQKEKKKSNKEF